MSTNLAATLTELEPETRRFAALSKVPLRTIETMRVRFLSGLDELSVAFDNLASAGIDPAPLARQFATWLRAAADAFDKSA